MRIRNHDVEFNTRSRWPITYFRVQTGGYPGLKFAIRWYKFSLTVDQTFLEEIEVHKDCNGEVHGIGEDGISYCTECEHIVEGDTEYITQEEYERRA